jgi:glycosyltransferase involved in cell wall biosynthesis
MKPICHNINQKTSLKIMKSTISVVIPVYNGEAFISHAITSVLNQSVQAFEVIVINDGSQDGTAEILAAFGDSIKLISIPNGGVSNARNTGIKASTGEFIAFLDADDIWYKDKLKRQLEIFERYPDVGFCCCDYEFVDTKSNLTINHFAKFKDTADIIFDTPLPLPLDALVHRNFVGTCSNVILKKAVLDKVGIFNINYLQAEDYDLWLRCALVTKFVLLSTVLLEKKSHDSNLTNNFLETLLFNEQVLINLQSNNQTKVRITQIRNEYLSALALLRYEIGNLHYEADHQIKAFKYFFLGLGTTITANNLKIFSLDFFGRKLLRTISFGLIHRKPT